MKDGGQTTLEYVLVVVFIVLAIILAFKSADLDEAVREAAGTVENSVTVE